MLRLSLALVLSFALGCARARDSAEGPGQPCETDSECNHPPDGGSPSCGFLRLCISGRCEASTDAGGSQLLICRDAD
jgi:hypothetical protein